MTSGTEGGGLLDVTGRVAIVTGGNRGIGLGIAEGLSRAGALVSIWGRSDQANRDAVQRLRAQGGGDVVSQVCDITDGAQIEAALQATVDRFGHIDGCFANAGMMAPPGRYLEYPTEGWRRTLQVNLEGTFLTTQAVAAHMAVAGRGGSIVVTSSVVVGFGNPGRAPYGVSKEGQVALVRTMAVELAHHGIRVNAVLPGWTATEMTRDLVDADDERTARLRQTILERIPVGRFGDPGDFAGIALYLLSDASRYHTGDTITVDGGYAVR